MADYAPLIRPTRSILVSAGLGEDIVGETVEPVSAGVAEVLQTKKVLDASQQRIVIVRHFRHGALFDEARQQHRSDAAAARPDDARAVVDTVVDHPRMRIRPGRFVAKGADAPAFTLIFTDV